MDVNPVTLSRVESRKTLTAVLDFDVGQHEDAVRSVVEFWSKKDQIQRVITVSTKEIEEGADQDLLDGDIVLYGDLTAQPRNPVFQAFRGTRLDVLEKRAAGFSSTVGVTALGKNPFSDGYAAVFAAAGPDRFARLHDYYDGSMSLVLTLSDHHGFTALFDEAFERIDPRIGLNHALEDVANLFRTIEEAHPQPLLHISPDSYSALKRGVEERLRQIADHGSNVGISDLAIAGARAVAALNDGHTAMWLDQEQVDIFDPTRRMLPFEITCERNGFYVVHPTREKHREEIVSINDMDPLGFLEPVLAAISGEMLSHKLSVFVRNQGIYWYLLAPIDGDTIAIKTRKQSGQESTRNFGLVSILEHQTSIVSSGTGEGFVENRHRFHHSGETCYYRFDGFWNTDAQKAYADGLFAEVVSKGTKNLVIDLRFNGGGNSSYGDYLLDYLTGKPYRMAARMDLKLSDHFYAQHGTVHEDLKGLTTTERIAAKEPNDRGLRFSGSLYVLTGQSTYSSAHMFASAVKDYALGTLIGEETGETRLSFGEVLIKTLPNSGLRFNVSCKQWFAPIPQFDDEVRGTVPDVLVDEEIFEKYADADDPVLSFAMDYIADTSDLE